MYESTIVALNSLYPKLSPGGFVIIDDYDLHGCRAAVDDFRRDHGITSAIKFIDGAGIWWRKSRVSRNSNP
jgi:O-methyltransferase